MAGIVQILGMAPNLDAMPLVSGAERWCSNSPRSYRIKYPPALSTYTRWFNIHTLNHIKTRYPSGYKWYRMQEKPIYLQQTCPEIPSSLEFPRHQIQDYFSINGEPNKFFTCSASWYIAFAILEGFERIELWGFQLRREHQYDWERPCFFYWVDQARKAGIDIYLPRDVAWSDPGDPADYDGPLYGYEPHTEYYKQSF